MFIFQRLSCLACNNNHISDVSITTKFQLAVLVELLPISGVPNGSSVVAVSVLPCNLFTTKPRLCVKALAADAKTAEGRK